MAILKKVFQTRSRTGGNPEPDDHSSYALAYDTDTPGMFVLHEWHGKAPFEGAPISGSRGIDLDEFLTTEHELKDSLLALLMFAIPGAVDAASKKKPTG